MGWLTFAAGLILAGAVLGLILLAIPFREWDELDPYWDDDDV